MGYRETKAKDPDYWNRRNRQSRDRYPERHMVHRARRRAKQRGLDFDLEVSDIIIPTHCPVLGIPLVPTSHGRNQDDTPTLDRIIGARGYVKGNVEVISWKANRLKGDATPEELRRLADYYGQKNRKSSSTKDKERPTEEV